MISGVLLLDKDERLGVLFKKRIMRMVLILTVFSIFYYVIDIVRNPELSFHVLDFCKKLLTGQILESFWFLYAYLAMLMILPFLRKMISGGVGYQLFAYLLALKIGLGILPGLFPEMVHIPWISNLIILETIIFYPLLGYGLEQYLAERKTDKRGLILSIFMICFGVGITVFMLEWSKHRSGVYNQQYLDLFVPIFVLAVFYLAKHFSKFISGKVAAAILVLGQSTFLVYLLEKLVRIMLLPAHIYLADHTFGILANSFYVLGTVIVAYMMAILLRKIKFLGEYV
jgi:hypothetical protein